MQYRTKNELNIFSTANPVACKNFAKQDTQISFLAAFLYYGLTLVGHTQEIAHLSEEAEKASCISW